MAIVENKATEDGDILVIKTNVPIVGIISLTSFIDSTVGETGSTYFERLFRYSIDAGMTYSQWMELSTINIQGIVIEKVDYFIVEYRYRRVGEEIVDLEFESVTMMGQFEELNYPSYSKILFAKFFSPNNVSVLGWAINVLEKLYKRGIIPSYIVRDQGGDDKDFVAYWFSITHFFALFVYYSRLFENIPGDYTLMKEFAIGRGLYMKTNPDVEELLYIYGNYIDEIRKRGTKKIGEREETIDGELLRLIDYISTDEFLFALTLRGELGWCIGQSSPLYTGADNIVNLIKGYEFTEEVVDLSKYPLINSDYISLVDGKIEITSIPAEEVAGIGYSSGVESGGYYYGEAIGSELVYPSLLSEEAIVIDPTLDYEVSFRVQKSQLDADLSFGVSLFDINGNAIIPTRITDGISDDRFFEVKSLNIVDTEYWIRGILYARGTSLIPTDKLNIGFGQSLRLSTQCIYLVPVIIVENNSGSNLVDVVKIWDIKVRPSNLWFSRGTLSSRNFIIGFLKSRSTEYNNSKIQSIIEGELIPYNTFTLLKFL